MLVIPFVTSKQQLISRQLDYRRIATFYGQGESNLCKF